MSGTFWPLLGFPFLGLSVAPNGAISAQAPDGVPAGGNARGVGAVDWQTIRNAATQVASGANSTIGGGLNSTATGPISTIGGGSANFVSGVATTVAGGQANTASGNMSWCPGGQFSTTRGVFGRGAWASNRITTPGDAQSGEHILMRQTTDAAATRMTADLGVAGAANSINLPNFGAYAGQMTVVAKATGSTAAATWRVNLSAVRGNGAATIALYEGAGTAIVPTASSGLGSAWRLDIAADTTNGGIAVTATGAAATTINWSARFANVEAVTLS